MPRLLVGFGLFISQSAIVSATTSSWALKRSLAASRRSLDSASACTAARSAGLALDGSSGSLPAAATAGAGGIASAIAVPAVARLAALDRKRRRVGSTGAGVLLSVLA